MTVQHSSYDFRADFGCAQNDGVRAEAERAGDAGGLGAPHPDSSAVHLPNPPVGPHPDDFVTRRP